MLPSRVLIEAQIEARAGSTQGEKARIFSTSDAGCSSVYADDRVSFHLASSLGACPASDNPEPRRRRGGFLLTISIGPRHNEIGNCAECGGIIDGPCVEFSVVPPRRGQAVYVLLHRRCAGDIASDMKKISEQ